MAASRLGVPAERCVVVEDAVPGVEAARRAGMRSIGAARNGKPLDADIVVASLEDLPGDAFERLVSAAA
jgi:beta-phosphoglucomutase-like phosphatase (HAD superfamily)